MPQIVLDECCVGRNKCDHASEDNQGSVFSQLIVNYFSFLFVADFTAALRHACHAMF
jgi:hypothetical protein